MKVSRRVAALVTAGTMAAACSSGSGGRTAQGSGATATTPATSKPRPADELGIDLSNADRCDVLVPDRCLLPFPSDHFTVEDPETPTGLRVNLREASLPANADGDSIDPSEWNRGDGFSPGSAILVSLPGVDLEASGAPPIEDIGASLEGGSPIVIVDADTGERHPFWAEMDANAESDSERTLMLRPAVNFREGDRYVVGFREMVDESGDPLEVSPAFAAYRDGRTTTDGGFEARRVSMESAFETLGEAGVGRVDLQLAWDFTVASADNLAGRMLHMRDDAFKSLGDHAPAFTVDQVVESPNDRVMREILGTFQVPSYLEGDGAPGSKLAYGDGGLPERQPAPFVAKYRCIIPPAAAGGRSGEVRPARMSLYGHGLLGDYGELDSDMVQDMSQKYEVAYCATNWVGMAEEDTGNAIRVLGDLSTFGTIPDRTQQGFLNFLFLGRLMKHPLGFASNEAFQFDGVPLIDNEDLYFDGNSEGAIFGGALMAIAQDFTRGVLGEAGMNYSMLLHRSVDFDEYKLVFEPAYPDPYDQLVSMSLMQMLWDRGETDGYAQHITSDPYPDTPKHTILLLGAVGDHQVSEFALQVEARTIGARGHVPYVADDRQRGDAYGWGIDPIASYPWDGSAYFLFDTGSPLAPLENLPPREGHDPHDDTPNIPAAQELKDAFWHPDGQVIDVCSGAPCTGEPHA